MKLITINEYLREHGKKEFDGLRFAKAEITKYSECVNGFTGSPHTITYNEDEHITEVRYTEEVIRIAIEILELSLNY